MKFKVLAFLISITFILTGCNAPKESVAFSEQDNMLEDRVMKLESLTEKSEQAIEDLHIEMQFKDEKIRQLYNKQEALFHLIENAPYIEKKQGYITGYQKENGSQYFIIDYAELVSDDYSPNRFHIKNEVEEKDRVEILDGLALHTVEDIGCPEFPSMLEIDELLERIDHFKKGFYNLYFIEDDLMLIVRQYIP